MIHYTRAGAPQIHPTSVDDGSNSPQLSLQSAVLDDMSPTPPLGDSPTLSSPTINLQVFIPELQLQKCLTVSLDEIIWDIKRKLFESLPQPIQQFFNFGLFLPPCDGRAGKFLLEDRPIRDYPFHDCAPYVELKYKKRVYKMLKMDEKALKNIHSKTNLKKFIEHIQNGNVEKVEKMCLQGLDPNFHDANGETPLTIAAGISNHRNVIIQLVGGGAHLDFRNMVGQTAIHRAAFLSLVENVRTLLELGASPNYRDSIGLTPLYYSTLSSEALSEVVEMLLAEVAELNVLDMHKNTALHQACKNGLVKHVEQLLFYGSEINAQNVNGNTPLHVCAVHGRSECAQVLLYRGADPRMANNQGKTALNIADDIGNLLVSDLIRGHNPLNIVPFRTTPKFNARRRLASSNSSHHIRRRSFSHSSMCSSSIGGQTPYTPIFNQPSVSSLPSSNIPPPPPLSHPSVPSASHQPNIVMHNRMSPTPSCGSTIYSSQMFVGGGGGPSSDYGTLRRVPPEAIKTAQPGFEPNIPRILVIPRGPKGFGFILRGAMSVDQKLPANPGGADLPSQFFEGVDASGMAIKAGLRPGDYLLEINGIDVRRASHEQVVHLIQQSGDNIALKVITLQDQNNNHIRDPTASSGHYAPAGYAAPQLGSGFISRRNKSVPRTISSKENHLPPPPPQRHPSTSLSFGKAGIYLSNRGRENFSSVKNPSLSRRISAAELEHLMVRQSTSSSSCSNMQTHHHHQFSSSSAIPSSAVGSHNQQQHQQPNFSPFCSSIVMGVGVGTAPNGGAPNVPNGGSTVGGNNSSCSSAPKKPTIAEIKRRNQQRSVLQNNSASMVDVSLQQHQQMGDSSGTTTVALRKNSADSIPDNLDEHLLFLQSGLVEADPTIRGRPILRPKTPPPPPPPCGGLPPQMQKRPSIPSSLNNNFDNYDNGYMPVDCDADDDQQQQWINQTTAQQQQRMTTTTTTKAGKATAPPPAPPPPPPDIFKRPLKSTKSADDHLSHLSKVNNKSNRQQQQQQTSSSSAVQNSFATSGQRSLDEPPNNGVTSEALKSVRLKPVSNQPPPLPKDSSQQKQCCPPSLRQKFDSDLQNALAKRKSKVNGGEDGFPRSSSNSSLGYQQQEVEGTSSVPHGGTTTTTAAAIGRGTHSGNNNSRQSQNSALKPTIIPGQSMIENLTPKNAISSVVERYNGLSLRESVRENVPSPVKPSLAKAQQNSPSVSTMSGCFGSKKDSGYTSSRTSLEPSEYGDDNTSQMDAAASIQTGGGSALGQQPQQTTTTASLNSNSSGGGQWPLVGASSPLLALATSNATTNACTTNSSSRPLLLGASGLSPAQATAAKTMKTTTSPNSSNNNHNNSVNSNCSVPQTSSGGGGSSSGFGPGVNRVTLISLQLEDSIDFNKCRPPPGPNGISNMTPSDPRPPLFLENPLKTPAADYDDFPDSGLGDSDPDDRRSSSVKSIDDNNLGHHPTDTETKTTMLTNDFLTKKLADWTNGDVASWLHHLQLDEYAESFSLLTGAQLIGFNRAKFTQFGVTRIAHRQIMEKSLREAQNPA